MHNEVFRDAMPEFSDGGARREWLIEALGETICGKLGLFPIPDTLTLSVVIPVYDEKATIHEILRRVRAVPIKKQIIVVDDCSRDGTREILRELEKSADGDLKVIFQDRNQGGREPRLTHRRFRYATGDIVIVQDADLEYEPEQYPELIQPIVSDQADVVFGSRFIGETHRVLYFRHLLANKFLTLLSNMFTNLNLTDMEVCYKVFRREVIQGITLKSNRFGFEPEVTAKVARFKLAGRNGEVLASQPCRVYEVPVAYHGRTFTAKGRRSGAGKTVSRHSIALFASRSPTEDKSMSRTSLAARLSLVPLFLAAILLAFEHRLAGQTAAPAPRDAKQESQPGAKEKNPQDPDNAKPKPKAKSKRSRTRQAKARRSATDLSSTWAGRSPTSCPGRGSTGCFVRLASRKSNPKPCSML